MHKITKTTLEKIYIKYNRQKYIHPDPLEFLSKYDDIDNREIVAIIASSLAYGRVTQILKSINTILGILGPRPKEFIIENSKSEISKLFNGFKHRFTTGKEMSSFICGLKTVISQYGLLMNCFKNGFNNDDENYLNALDFLVGEIKKASQLKKSSLLPDPSRGSACKRLNLFLRWMIRKDNVDPGGWNKLPASKLIVPLDTHMYYFGKCYGFTERKSADIKTASEITNGFKEILPEDPVKYDFAISRFGIRGDICWEDLENFI
ncbi:TIGR02757 family protein [Spirochaetota bacterium]